MSLGGEWKDMKALLLVLITNCVAYSLRSLRTAREIRSVFEPLVVKRICEKRAEAACFQTVEPEKCLETFNKACDENVAGLQVQEYIETFEMTEVQENEAPTGEVEKKGESGVLWELGVLICLALLLLFILSISVIICWRSLRLEKTHKAVPEIEFKKR